MHSGQVSQATTLTRHQPASRGDPLQFFGLHELRPVVRTPRQHPKHHLGADDRGKVHHWVATNIRYISLSLVDGGWVPRTADSVLHNLYGDCKDHVVLFVSQCLLDHRKRFGIEPS